MTSMDGKTLEQIRDTLLARWKQIGKSSDMDFTTMEMNMPQAEIIDIAQSLEQIDRDSSLAEQERRELVAIERALAKMATGSFGVCEDCGEDIPHKRLMVIPQARLCANCQAYEEKLNSRMRSVNVASR